MSEKLKIGADCKRNDPPQYFEERPEEKGLAPNSFLSPELWGGGPAPNTLEGQKPFGSSGQSFATKLNQMRQAIFFTMLLLLPGAILSQSPEDFKKAMNDGDSRAVASFVHSFVDLQVGQSHHRVNRSQAERLLRDFFENKGEIRFLFRHQSGRNSGNGSQFKIGRLDADNQRYRVFVLFGSIDGKTEIRELSIERE